MTESFNLPCFLSALRPDLLRLKVTLALPFAGTVKRRVPTTTLLSAFDFGFFFFLAEAAVNDPPGK